MENDQQDVLYVAFCLINRHTNKQNEYLNYMVHQIPKGGTTITFDKLNTHIEKLNKKKVISNIETRVQKKLENYTQETLENTDSIWIYGAITRLVDYHTADYIIKNDLSLQNKYLSVIMFVELLIEIIPHIKPDKNENIPEELVINQLYDNYYKAIRNIN